MFPAVIICKQGREVSSDHKWSPETQVETHYKVRCGLTFGVGHPGGILISSVSRLWKQFKKHLPTSIRLRNEHIKSHC